MRKIKMDVSKIKKKPLVLAFFLHLLLMAPGALSAEDKILVLTEQLYPMNYTENGSDDGIILGFATQLVIEILEEAKLEYEINMVPWARAIHSIDNNKNVIVYTMTRSPERQKKYHWIGDIWIGKINLYGHRDKLKNWPLSLAQIRKLKVGTSRGSVSRDYLMQNGFRDIVTIKSMDSYMRLLDRGRIDLFPFLDFSVGMAAKRQGFDKRNLISVLSLTAIPLNLAIAASKSTDIKTVKLLQSSYTKIRQSSRYKTIMAPLEEMIADF
ncbi:MAG: polar amino acid transport system substrate-binding protein [Candidatus Azotimanducaceae bacterium]|jgi:polar amino acid transport system substrate-binding protein